MEWLREQAVVAAADIWRAKNGEPWLLSFDFAEVDGRLECIGLEIRSYLHDERHDELGPYRSYSNQAVSREDLIPPLAELPTLDVADPQSRAASVEAGNEAELALAPATIMRDTDIVDALVRGSEPLWAPRQSPRPLRTATLRELPLGDLLVRLRRRIADEWRSGAAAPRTLLGGATAEPDATPGEPAPELVARRRECARARAELEDRTWELLTLVRQRGGYDDELLRQRDELSQQFAELDRQDKPERDRQRELSRKVDVVMEEMNALVEKSFDGTNYDAQYVALRARLSDLEAQQLGRAERAESAPEQRLVPLDGTQFIRLTQEAASSFALPGQKAGRPPQYSLAQLELIAKTYREAYRSGSTSPTKDVAAKLGMTRARAAKLVMRCRDPRVGLLAPTTKRQAGETNRQRQEEAESKAGRP